MSTDSTKKIISVTKALKILTLISQAKEGMTTTEISNALGQSASATYHILNTLRSEGFIRQDKASKKFYLGYALVRIAEKAKEQTPLQNLGRDILRRLTEVTQETSNLVILDGEHETGSESALWLYRRREGDRRLFACGRGASAGKFHKVSTLYGEYLYDSR